jgi:MFS transporter, SP family, general alpha glucoside:H+ symporter
MTQYAEEKNVDTTVEYNEHTEAIGHLANQEDHEETVRQALTRHPKTIIWCLYAIWVLVITSFDNQVGGVVIGIPEFRKDYGSAFEGNYVLPAKWQSAYSGGPVAS